MRWRICESSPIPADEVSLTRIANVPTRGLSDATLKTFSLYGAMTRGMSLWDAMAGAGVGSRHFAAGGQFSKTICSDGRGMVPNGIRRPVQARRRANQRRNNRRISSNARGIHFAGTGRFRVCG